VPQRIGEKKGEDETIKGGANFENSGLVGFECRITRTRQHGEPLAAQTAARISKQNQRLKI
jgi:hypothetical protein